MGEVVLDASAILALLFEEPGAEQVRPHAVGASVSAVSLAEVVCRLTESGWSEPDMRSALAGLQLLVIPFDPADAWETGFLRRRTRSQRLSLADRACIALALSRGVPAITTDRAWARLGLGAAVRVVGR